MNNLFTENKDSSISIYTDGSCIGNPGPGGYCAIILDDGMPVGRITGKELDTTNNRMEMMAILQGLRWLNKNSVHDRVKIYSDSNLIVSTVNKGWKKKANTDLWEKIDQELLTLNINFIWVKAHANNKWNNECDKYAQQEARSL